MKNEVAPQMGSLGLRFFLLALIVRLPFVFVAGNNGSDAWVRFRIAQDWLQHPNSLPSSVWLPLPFWILGAALRIYDSEWTVRLLTVAFGSLTVLPYWGIVRRLFDRRTAVYATLGFCVYGLHVAYSVTSSSEAPTILLQAVAVYAWVRFRFDGHWIWLMSSGLALSAACLCRYEPWLMLPVLSMFVLDFSRGASAWSGRDAARAAVFAITASAGAVGWMVYSLVKWGDPLASAHRTAWLNARMPHQELWARIVSVPGALAVTLSPVLLGLVIIGIVRVVVRRDSRMLPLAAVAVAMAVFHCFIAIAKNSTMARYTLMYGWLLIPYAFEALEELHLRWRWIGTPKAYSALLAFFLLWQGGIIAGAHYGPQWAADRLSTISPTLPLSVELRKLTRWLKTHSNPNDAIVVDEFNYEAGDLIRYSGLSPTHAFVPPWIDSDPEATNRQLMDFISRQHPRLLVYSPEGRLGSLWALEPGGQVDLINFGLRLHLLWQGNRYRVYAIENLHAK